MGGFRLGSIFGLEVRIDFSWFIIFFLILWTFIAGVYPATVPELSTTTHVAMGVVATLLFFASLLAHEISHSLVARAKDVPVEGITLFVFGGMAHTRMEAESPGDEFTIAGVGPLSSLVIAAAFGLLAWGGSALGWPEWVTVVAAHLAYINTALALFNLVPGFPLDGGRLFRAAVWRFTGDLRKATRWATAGGKAVGYILIGVGLLQVFAGGLVGGLWLVFIGWFVRKAAEASFIQHLLTESLEGVRARDVMTEEPETVDSETTVEEFVGRDILQRRPRAYPVMQGGRAVGLVTLDRIKKVPKEERSRTTLAKIMTPLEEEMVVRPDEEMSEVVQRLGQIPEGRVLVTRNGALEGIITRSDLRRWLERAELLEAD